MSKTNEQTGATGGGRRDGLTVRVPLEVVKKLRELAAEVPRGALETEAEVLRKLALRALVAGVERGGLVPREGGV